MSEIFAIDRNDFNLDSHTIRGERALEVAKRFRPVDESALRFSKFQQSQTQGREVPRPSKEAIQATLQSISTRTTDTRLRLPTAFVAKQEWEGCVQDVAEGQVLAQLVDIRLSDAPFTIASIPLETFAVRDRKRLRTGSIFRWAIGTEINGRTQRNAYRIAIRDFPAWTRREILTSESEGLQLAQALSALKNGSDASGI